MAIKKIIKEVSEPQFYQRVSYISLGVAQDVATEDPATLNHANRVAYSNRIFRGEESALLLAMHVVASNATIEQTIDTSGGQNVPDADIEFALAGLWDARANAYAAAV